MSVNAAQSLLCNAMQCLPGFYESGWYFTANGGGILKIPKEERGTSVSAEAQHDEHTDDKDEIDELYETDNDWSMGWVRVKGCDVSSIY